MVHSLFLDQKQSLGVSMDIFNLNKKNVDVANQEVTRVIARELARELDPQEIEEVSGGTTSCKSGVADDCDSVY